MPHCYFIDTKNQKITYGEFDSLSRDLQTLVEGYLELAYSWPNGDALYVNEEGLLKDFNTGFFFALRRDQVLMGNGVVVGREVETEDTWFHADPSITLGELTSLIQFVKASSNEV